MQNDALLRARAGFAGHFGHAPRLVASAPGRVNLIGEFTDYNEGFVLPIALEYRTVVCGTPNESNLVTVRSEATQESVSLDLRRALEPDAPGRWSNYIRGVLAGFGGIGTALRGFDAFIASDVPMGAGLSSSAAIEVAFATLLEGIHGVKLDPVAKALLCQKAEHSFAGVPCGIMDLFIASLAREDHALLLDCRSNEAVWLPFADPAVAVLILNTNVRHQLATSAYAIRREECQAAASLLKVGSLRAATLEMLAQHVDPLERTVMRRARHVVGEIARTLQAAEVIRDRDWIELGQLMYASHDSLRNYYEVSCRELDAVVHAAREIGTAAGVYGCRMTGGGFGGCAVALIDAPRREAIERAIRESYGRSISTPLTCFTSRPGRGAELLEA